MGSQQTTRPVLTAWAFLFVNFPLCRTRSEDSADRVGGRAAQDVLRKESEGEVTQEETECFDRSDRVLPGEPFREEKVASVSIVLLQDLPPLSADFGLKLSMTINDGIGE
jgi:hypothetical protein